MSIEQFFKKSLLLLLFSSVTLIAVSQTIVITGKVTDDSNNPVPGATISAKGSAASTTADQNGLFKLNVNNRVKTLMISSVGFTEQEVAIDGRTEINVVMVIDNKSKVCLLKRSLYGLKQSHVVGTRNSLNHFKTLDLLKVKLIHVYSSKTKEMKFRS